MKNSPQPMFDSATHYRVEVLGQVDVSWLRSFEDSAQIDVDEIDGAEGTTILSVHTDQSGMIGLLRRLHGLGVTILGLGIVFSEGNSGRGNS